MIFHFDFESASEIDITKLGAYRYASDITTRILMFAICRGLGQVYIWRFDQPDSEESMEALRLLQEAIDSKALIFAFNAQFELAITRYRGRKDLGLDALPEIDNWRCVKAMAQKAALPANLKGAAEMLRVTEKSEHGRALIDVFSVLTKEITLQAPADVKIYDKSEKGRKAPNRKSFSPIFGWNEGSVHHDEVLWDWFVSVNGNLMTVRAAWELFIEYCRQDVVCEREVHAKLHKFELIGASLESYQFNLRMNDRGVPVNISALENALKLINQYKKRANVRFQNMTGLTPTQNAKFKVWLQARGYFKDNLKADTVDEFLDDFSDLLTPVAHDALSLYKLLNFAALAKVPAMLNSACPDGYVRGTLLWHGARTGRATGKLVQVQNIKKAKVETELCYRMICEGCSLEDIEEFWLSPLEMIASCARHFINLPGTRFYDADFVGVEARLAPWIVSDEDKLSSILRGEDQYRVVAGAIYNIPWQEIRKPSKERDVGKRAELACQFGTGGNGLKFALKELEKLVIPLKEAKHIVDVYRTKYHKTTEGWNAIETAAKLAITENKTSKLFEGRVRIGKVTTAGISYLVMQLPSGRRLYYPRAEVNKVFKKYTAEEMADADWKAKQKGYWQDEIRFWGARPNNAGWGWVGTWGSRLYENCFTPDTEVLTEAGWRKITEVGTLRVSDGVEWVSHSGLKESLANDVIRVDGLGVTRKHLILTSDGWTAAEDLKPEEAYGYYRRTALEHQGHHGTQSRPLGGPVAAPTFAGRESLVALPMRLRGNLHAQNRGNDFPSEKGDRAMQPQVPPRGLAQGDARDVLPPCLLGLPVDDRPVPTPHASSLAQLWRTWDHSLRAMAGRLRELLGGYGRPLLAGYDLGPARQQQGLRGGQLPVDRMAATVCEQTVQRLGGHPLRADDAFANLRQDGDRANDHPLPLESGGERLGAANSNAGPQELVYDLLNCGHRHRFVVRAPGGQAVIAHNCVQAMGADLLDEGCIAATKAGFDIFLLVHDQALCYKHPSKSLKDFENAFTSVGEWAKTFPLAADADEVPYYKKELD